MDVLIFAGGSSVVGAGGSICLSGGPSDGSEGGAIQLLSGSSNTLSGNVSICSHPSFGTGCSGSVSMFSGTSSEGISGDINISTGNAINGAVGNMNIMVGQGTGCAGRMLLQSGSTNGAFSGGNVDIKAGHSISSGRGGAICFVAGRGIGDYNDGGSIYTQSGSAKDAPSGDILIFTATSERTSTGKVVIKTGAAREKSGDTFPPNFPSPAIKSNRPPSPTGVCPLDIRIAPEYDSAKPVDMFIEPELPLNCLPVATRISPLSAKPLLVRILISPPAAVVLPPEEIFT